MRSEARSEAERGGFTDLSAQRGARRRRDDSSGAPPSGLASRRMRSLGH